MTTRFNHFLFLILLFASMILYSCKARKNVQKSSTPDTATNPSPRSTEAESAAAPAGPITLNPGNAELKAIQTRFPDATLVTLSKGYSIYSGVCTGCHKQKDMFVNSEEDWKHDADRMSKKAHISDEEKDALWKYVLAMRLSRGTKK
jgi:hypothetical protein